MVKTNTIYLGIIGLLVIALILRGCGDKPVIVDHYNYVTDTTYSSRQYKELFKQIAGLEEKLSKTPPKEIIYYPTPDPSNVIIEKIPDSLLVYIVDLKNENDSLRIVISDKYIKNYPRADKLIDFKLTQEAFDITSLDIKGDIKTGNYPLYLDTYDYYWKENSLHHIKRDKPNKIKIPNQWDQLYVNAGYDFIVQSPTLKIDYSKTFGRFRVGTTGQIYIEENPNLRADIVLGYRLLK